MPRVEGRTSAATEAEPLTGAGAVLGTLPYMAPEQVEGRPADARTDLWALGAIVYEMLTGARAFEAPTPTGLAAAILEREPPPLAERRPLTPPSLDRLVRRCLAKDPDDRWDTAHDVADELRWVAEAHRESEVPRVAPTGRRWAIPALAVLVVVALLAGVLADRLWFRHSESARAAPVVRSTIDLTADRPLGRVGGMGYPLRRDLALSRDGRLLVWAADREDDQIPSALYLRRLDTGEVTRLRGTEGASEPSFSPDGGWIAFSAPGPVLRKVSVERELTVDLAELPGSPRGVSWAADGKILLGAELDGVQWVPAAGGAPRPVTTVDVTREGSHLLPSALPGGRALFTTLPTQWGGTARIEAVSLSSGSRRVVVEDGTDARFLPTGHLVFMRRSVLMAAPFDPERLELTAPPAPVLEGVSRP